MTDVLLNQTDIENLLSKFRHDLRNKLTPAMMIADSLSNHQQADVKQKAQIIIDSLEATLNELQKLRVSQ
ncbi:hypothetical protein GT348_02815 [Aristophania vespae]|uniref:Uncharacterized protein n=1 Tax=Aristophania vespae TaxID=2697033 RepID=A0A6P1NI63_9PROT|nr:hypothetical protein [Aristophania vespae]QHI95342.1 hypothetical protein GT348_02815 [Aristophania vespae]UMM64610.1 hypothetical protein DM15PD_16260 [Aristophania vespae]